RAAFGLREGAREREREALLLLRAQKARDRQPASVRDQEQALDAEFLVLVAVELHPDRIERPLPHAPVIADLAHRQLGGCHSDDLISAGGAEIHPESPVDQQHVEAHEAEDRPGAGAQKIEPDGEAQAAEYQHEDQEALGAERAVRCQHGRKDRGFRIAVIVGFHVSQYRGSMARKTPRKKPPRKPASKRVTTRSVQQSRKRARAGKAASVKGAKTRVAADQKALAGAMPQWTQDEVAEAFRRLRAARPEPKGELEHVDPYTLLIAVVLSAQATDAGVNKATPALFAAADTPAQMVALGEAKVRDFIKTIGLYRNKAKNVIALSQRLIDDYGGVVPPSREALESLPGVGRKTANVVLNIAFGELTIAVDTHIFRVGNRTGLAPGKTPFEVEEKLLEVVPDEFKRHAHHWLILHGRYVCVARRPLCEKCLIADLCRYPGKTTLLHPSK